MNISSAGEDPVKAHPFISAPTLVSTVVWSQMANSSSLRLSLRSSTNLASVRKVASPGFNV